MPNTRRVIMWNLITLDGFFEGSKSWELEFHKLAWGKELEEISIQQLRLTDTLLFGRITYEGMAAYWTQAQGEIADLMNSIHKMVFSQTLAKADWNNSTLVKDPPEQVVAKLRQERGKDAYIFGSAGLSATLTRHGLIDEYRLCVVPVLWGHGNHLFRESPTVKMKLLEAGPLSNGCVILRYEPEKAA